MFPKLLPLLFAPACACAALDPSDSYQPENTQAAGQEPPSPQAAASGWKVPAGFHVTLFAGEPDVRQPIDMKTDDRGRVWVCEAYSYKQWQKKGGDRIIILTDDNGDGIADHRKVFRDGFNHLSSVEIGFGGVWVLDTPNLLFFPDANGDDAADGAPQVILDGWTDQGQHNVVNGLQWGPDGWLYGRHGITHPSLVGKPGTAEKERTFVEPGIWRLHPRTREFQIVVRGTTNPWGFDWDENGEMFMSGNVNGHLWHVIPGALFERMFGAGSVPHDFERLKMIGEAPHYQTSGDWKQDWLRAEKGRDAANNLGGGHSHCGLLIYQGANWPEDCRGKFFMCNTHGRRINREEVFPAGCSFRSRHIDDIAAADTPWFRGVSLVSGPDGGVFVSDWCDSGECHDDDGVHRTSGRIYKITHGTPQPPPADFDLAKWPLEKLTATIRDPNVWFSRHAGRIVQERRPPLPTAGQFVTGTTPQKLRALWMLHGSGALTLADCRRLLQDAAVPVRCWTVRCMADAFARDTDAQKLLAAQAAADRSPLVLAHLLGVSHRLPPDAGWHLATTVAARPENIGDHTLALLTWHALEPLIQHHLADVPTTFAAAASPLVRQFLARRCAAEIEDPACREAAGRLLELAAERSKHAGPVLAGLRDGLAGRSQLRPPDAWKNAAATWFDQFTAEVTAIGLAFGDPSTLDLLRKRATDAATPADLRSQALLSLARVSIPDLNVLVSGAFTDKSVRLAAIQAAAALSDPQLPEKFLAAWTDLTPQEKSAAIDTLASRPAWASQLLTALGAGKVARQDISQGQARQISLLQDPAVHKLLAQHWGRIGSSGSDRKSEIERYRNLLTSGKLGDPARGKAVFAKTCAACHTLFGEGGKLGPDLTGSGRKEADYLLLNVIDPNAVVPRDYQMTAVTLQDGQVLTGTVPREDDRTLALQTLTELRTLERSTCRKIERLPVSWMPEGLFQQLPEQEFHDLMAYLMK